ncbi:Mg-protoporphyrin IX methyl transferase [Planctomycetes bacterium Pla163]|uniref:Mg-protoporphyrin IX methyl transferase n=1 Tax=Rohdeia mirabilis TaxID=2528008 RepID=A0A518CYG6_9BACT|nr:Mg-protoporphyrin IX methyl transferase [Planctomycetes bacterium Pla163]
MSDRRSTARELAHEALRRDEALAWFEELYALERAGAAAVPWADECANPLLVDWLDGALEGLPAAPGSVPARRALVVGTGFGDDAAELARRGYAVTAFDVAPSAIDRAVQRFPEAAIDWRVADLFDAPDAWNGAFDLVVEVNTLQVLPPDLRARAFAPLAGFVADGGLLFVACRARESDEAPGAMPWPLVPIELAGFERAGLGSLAQVDLVDDEDPPVRRLVALFGRASLDRQLEEHGVRT